MWCYARVSFLYGKRLALYTSFGVCLDSSSIWATRGRH